MSNKSAERSPAARSAVEATRTPQPPPGLVPKVVASGCLLTQFLLERMPLSAQLVWQYLDELARIHGPSGEINRFAWPSLRTIANEVDLSYSVVRGIALPWLRDHGWIFEQDGRIDGRKVTMFWCAWLGPFDQDGPPSTAPGRARSDSARFESGARDRAPTSKREFQEKKKDDRPRDAGRRRPVCASGTGEKNRGEPDATRAAPDPAPAPILDPTLVAVLAEQIPDPDERTKVEADAHAWLARFTVEWVVKAIVETVARRKFVKIHSLASYARGMLEDWSRQGYPTLRLTKPPPRPSTTNLPQVEDPAARAARVRAEAEAEAAKDAHSRALRDRWLALLPADREAIKARVLAERPAARRWPAMLESTCLALMDGGVLP